jgi:hypothetical protein
MLRTAIRLRLTYCMLNIPWMHAAGHNTTVALLCTLHVQMQCPCGSCLRAYFAPQITHHNVSAAVALLLQEIRRIWIGYWSQCDVQAGQRIAAKLSAAGAL